MTPRLWLQAALLLTAAFPAVAQTPAAGFTVLLGEGNVAAIRADSAGNLYVLGDTDSNELPTKSAFQPDLAPGDCDGRIGAEAPCPDLFLAKLTPGGELVYLTYLGGSGDERPIDLQVDSEGAAYVLGQTTSTNFPGTASLVGPPGLYFGPFLAKVSPDGQSLLEAVTLPEFPRALALDGATPIVAGAAEYVPIVGATPPSISDSAFFVGRGGEVKVRNAGLTGPIVDIAAAGGRLFALAYDVFVSNDGGETWTASGVASEREDWMLDMIAGRVVVAAPDDGATVYAAAQGKLLRTRNGGATWTDVTPQAPYASGSVAAGAGGRVYTANNPGGIYRSDDYGGTWTVDGTSRYVIRLLVDPANPDLVYAQRSEPHSYGAGLRFSADGGATWEERTFPTFSFGRQLGAASLLLDPSNSAHLHGLFQDQLAESLNGGQTWTDLSSLPGQARAVELSPAEPGVFYGLTVTGVVRSGDGGRTWEAVEGFPAQDYTAIAADPADLATLYAGARGSRLDGFLLRLAPDLRSITASTRFGGFGRDEPQAILVEATGDVLVGGVTDSLDFPSATPYGGGATDFFLARFSAADFAPAASSLLGGAGLEAGLKLAQGSDGAIYFGGASSSPDFPALPAGGLVPEGAAAPLFGALEAGLEQSRFARYLQVEQGGCVNALALSPAELQVVGSAGTDCEGEHTFGLQSAFAEFAGLDGELLGSVPIALDSASGGVVFADGDFAVTGRRWLGPATIPRAPSGLQQSANGAFVLRIANDAPSTTAQIAAVVDAAAFTGGPLAPGLIASVFGSGLGPAQGTVAEPVDGKLPTQAASTRVLIDGQPSPMLFAQEGQINFVAPFALEPRTLARIEVENDSGRSTPWFAPVSASHVGLFSSEGLGQGLLLALNEDGTLNDADRPAPAGSIVTVFGVGAGAMSPAIEDGAIAPGGLPLPMPNLDIAVTVDDLPGEILYSGAAPGLVAGVLQVNLRVPLAPALPRPLFVHLFAGGKRFGRPIGLWLYVGPPRP